MYWRYLPPMPWHNHCIQIPIFCAVVLLFLETLLFPLYFGELVTFPLSCECQLPVAPFEGCYQITNMLLFIFLYILFSTWGNCYNGQTVWGTQFNKIGDILMLTSMFSASCPLLKMIHTDSWIQFSRKFSEMWDSIIPIYR